MKKNLPAGWFSRRCSGILLQGGPFLANRPWPIYMFSSGARCSLLEETLPLVLVEFVYGGVAPEYLNILVDDLPLLVGFRPAPTAFRPAWWLGAKDGQDALGTKEFVQAGNR